MDVNSVFVDILFFLNLDQSEWNFNNGVNQMTTLYINSFLANLALE